MMADSEEPYLTLKWEMGAHLGILVSKFHSLFQQGKFLDVTLSADGQFLKAHRVPVILCASSQYLEDKLTLSKCDTLPVEMNLGNIKFDILKLIVDFMYKGEINVQLEQLHSLLEAATSLKIKVLIDQVRDLIKEVFSCTDMNGDPIVDNQAIETAEDGTINFYKEPVDLVVDSPLSNQDEALGANNHDDELLIDIQHNTPQLQFVEDENIIPICETRDTPKDANPNEIVGRSSVKRKQSLKDHSASKIEEQQPRKSLRLAAVQTKPHRNDDEEDGNEEEESVDDSSFISTNSTPFFDDESDNNEKGCSSHDSSSKPMRKSVAKKPTSSSAGSKGDVLTEKPFICHKCGLSYKQKVSLTRHLKSQCGKEKNASRFSCKKCDYQTNRKDNFRDHLKNIHKLNPSQLTECGAGYVLSFTCWVCKRTLKNAHSLGMHMLKSHGEKDASYFTCDHRSSSNSQRRRHIIDVHAIDPTHLADHKAGHLQ